MTLTEEGGGGGVIKGRISVKDRNSTATAAAAAEEPKGINIYTKIQAYPTDSITGYCYLTKLLLRWANVNSSVCQILETPAEGLKVPRGRLMRFTAGEAKLDLKLGEEIKHNSQLCFLYRSVLMQVKRTFFLKCKDNLSS